MKIGVLLIGSLFWEKKHHRCKWRRDRLNLNDKQYVKVPIRYGRQSSSRGKSYTMVFSSWLCREQHGKAIVVSCANDVTTGEDLVKEAECLWTAETPKGENPNNRISAKDGWGCVALLENPERPVPDDLRSSWTKRVSDEPDYGKKIIRTYGEEVVVNRRGFLKIPWPKIGGHSDLDFDALLATVTRPTLNNGCYPSAKNVATAAYRSCKGREYFCKNREHKIKTFQDTKIEDWLAKFDNKRARLQGFYTNTGE